MIIRCKQRYFYAQRLYFHIPMPINLWNIAFIIQYTYYGDPDSRQGYHFQLSFP